MKSATHRGTCQACGNVQKLPGGVLSVHGYTVEWGFFHGQCPGSNHLPLEQSKDMIERYITNAEQQIINLQASIEKLSKQPTEPRAWYQVPSKILKGGRDWGEVDLIATDNGIYIKLNNGRNEPARWGGYDGDNILDAAFALNQKYSQELTRTIEQVERYITWQQRRIKDWEPQPLLPLNDKPATAYSHNGLAGCVTQQNSQAGTLMSVYVAAEQGIDASSGEWATVCEAHNTILNSRTLNAAKRATIYPEWCTECAEMLASSR